MPLDTNLNSNPYWDDFDDTKRYVRILFRPAIAVQARELTQLQTIIQDQLEKFASNIFKDGAIVSGCAISDVPTIPYVRFGDIDQSNTIIDVKDYIGKTLVSSTTNLTARIITANSGSNTTYPNTNIAYVKYLNTGNNGATTFGNNEPLYVYNVPRTGNNTLDLVATVNTYISNSTTTTVGNARGVSVSKGLVFQKGFFIYTDSQIGIVNAYGTDAANAVIGFKTTETIITSDQDTSLTDNALGYENVNAPGAHRLQLTPQLVSLQANVAANTLGFSPIALYNYNRIVEVQQSPYNAIEDEIAKRSSETNGNFIIKPFTVDTIKDTSNTQQYIARVNPGAGYADGYRIETLKTVFVTGRRGTDTDYATEQQITTNYGNYVYVQEFCGGWNVKSLNSVNIYDTAQAAVTGHLFSTQAVSGNIIGTANIKAISYVSGIPGTPTALYKIFLFNIVMNSGKTFSNAKSIVFSSGSPIGYADLVNTTIYESSNRAPLWSFGKNALISLKNSSNAINTSYVARQIATGLSLQTDGTIVLNITSSGPGGTDVMPYGAGVYYDNIAQNFIISTNASAVSNTLSGTISVNSTSNVVTGSSTTFTSDFGVGEYIYINSTARRITSITNTTYLTVDTPFGSANTGTYTKYIPNGYIIPISQTLPGSRSITVSNSTSITIQTGLRPTSALNVTIQYDVKRTNTAAIKKLIKKNRYVVINTANAVNKNIGPWPLGISDVHKISAIYTGNSANVTSTDIKTKFVLDNGQKDTHYDYASIALAPGSSISANTWLTVQLDYFTANTSSGVGFFSVDSYPIDDANTANVNAIQTKDIPVYVSDTGGRYSLRDIIDFRPIANNIAVDTGYVDISNTSAMIVAANTASINPTNSITYSLAATGAYTPSPAQNMQADINYYLPRYDLFYVDDVGFMHIKEGAPADNPMQPVNPSSGMPIATLFVPPYPSLTSDEISSLSSINSLTKNIVRDVSSKISVSIVTNRRYTMRDIGTLDQRITNLEYYASLSLLEKQATDLQVVNGDGLNRFKNGIFVDPFNNSALGDVSNPEYRISIDSINSLARPYITRKIVELKYNANLSINIEKTGTVLTLPYNEIVFASQPFATGYQSADQYSYRWNGMLELYPSYDMVVDYTVNPYALSNSNVDQYFNSYYSQSYGDWRTQEVTETTATTTTTAATPNTVSSSALVAPLSIYANNAATLLYLNNNWQSFSLAQLTLMFGGTP